MITRPLSREDKKYRKIELMSFPYERGEPLYLVKKLRIKRDGIDWEDWGRPKNTRQLTDMLYENGKKLIFAPIPKEIEERITQHLKLREAKKREYLTSSK